MKSLRIIVCARERERENLCASECVQLPARRKCANKPNSAANLNWTSYLVAAAAAPNADVAREKNLAHNATRPAPNESLLAFVCVRRVYASRRRRFARSSPETRTDNLSCPQLFGRRLPPAPANKWPQSIRSDPSQSDQVSFGAPPASNHLTKIATLCGGGAKSPVPMRINSQLVRWCPLPLSLSLSHSCREASSPTSATKVAPRRATHLAPTQLTLVQMPLTLCRQAQQSRLAASDRGKGGGGQKRSANKLTLRPNQLLVASCRRLAARCEFQRRPNWPTAPSLTFSIGCSFVSGPLARAIVKARAC